MSTVNYRYPSTSAPTVGQVVEQSMVTAQIVMADADTVVVVAHAMQVTAAQLANGFPVSFFRFTSAPSTTLANAISIVNTDSSDITITKVAQTGSAFTGELVVLRPNTIIT